MLSPSTFWSTIATVHHPLGNRHHRQDTQAPPSPHCLLDPWKTRALLKHPKHRHTNSSLLASVFTLPSLPVFLFFCSSKRKVGSQSCQSKQTLNLELEYELYLLVISILNFLDPLHLTGGLEWKVRYVPHNDRVQ